MAVKKRTFEAKKHKIGSAERARLNEDALTSEYMPSYRYVAIRDNASTAFRTRAEADAHERRQP